MGGIFVNYRNGPHSEAVAAIADRLSHQFGADEVFFDTRMRSGIRYPDELRERLRASDVVVAVIHDGWTDEFAVPRDLDWVRFEITTALAMDKPVVPVLLGKVDPPRRDQLPDDLGELAVRQAARMRAADYGADLDHLVWLLERHVAPAHTAPPGHRVAGKPKRLGRRVVAWAAGLFLATPVLFVDAEWRYWEWFTFSALASTVLLMGLALLSMTLFPVIRRLTRRWDEEAGTISLREATRRRWIVLALGILPLVYLLSESGSRDGSWQEWEVWFMIVAVLFLLYYTHRTWRHYDAQDYAWPPPVSTEPAMFRRAAHRLYERLTTEPDWRRSRSRAAQRDAVSIYLDLADVRRELRARAGLSLTGWVRKCHSAEPAAYLGWLASIVALDVAALVALLEANAPARAYSLVGGSLVVAAGFTAAKIATDRYSDRRETARLVEELTGWQARLGPLIFC